MVSVADDGGSDDDDASAEGAVARGLFGNDSDSDEDERNEEVVEEEPASPENVYIEREILHVRLIEQQVGGSIAHRLWPAAEYLATFVLDMYAGKITDETLVQQRESSNTTEGQRQQEATHQVRIQACLDSLKIIFQNTPVVMVELGAGIGLTGLEIATQMKSNILLTELDEGMPLLSQNVDLNRDRFLMGPDAARALRSFWGDKDDDQRTLDWYHQQAQPDQPVLILASDCVYWEEFHLPLEKTLATLLSQSPAHSVCLIAGMRRWKRDNAFYQNLGRSTRTKTHGLQCVCLQETIRRMEESREVMRVYAVQWVPNDA